MKVFSIVRRKNIYEKINIYVKKNIYIYTPMDFLVAQW